MAQLKDITLPDEPAVIDIDDIGAAGEALDGMPMEMNGLFDEPFKLLQIEPEEPPLSPVYCPQIMVT